MKIGWVLTAWLGACAPALAQTAIPTAPVPPRAPPVSREASGPSGPMSDAEMRDLLDSARATAKATRESVDYARVVPDILTQILVKLDKIENKLDKVENAVKAGNRARR